MSDVGLTYQILYIKIMNKKKLSKVIILGDSAYFFGLFQSWKDLIAEFLRWSEVCELV